MAFESLNFALEILEPKETLKNIPAGRGGSSL